MKIVINTCYGGFSISPEAVKELAELKGRKCFFFTHAHSDLEKYIPCTLEEARKSFLWSAFTVQNPNKILAYKKKWSEMSMKEKRKNSELYDSVYLTNRPENRHDPDLISVVENLGKKANGGHADLKVVEIPDGVAYDGLEHVAEKHRIWA